MKNKIYLFGMLAVALMFAITVSGCDMFLDLLEKINDIFMKTAALHFHIPAFFVNQNIRC